MDKDHTTETAGPPPYQPPARQRGYAAYGPGDQYVRPQSPEIQQNPYHVGYDQPHGPQAPTMPQQTPMYSHNNTVVITQPSSQMIVAPVVPSSHLVLSILSCLCCFVPTGIAAIVCAVQAENAISRGDLEEARARGRNAMHLSIAGCVIGILLVVLMIVLFSVVGVQKTTYVY